jgi:DNA (cytosine-5)-methyltransferase 1
MSYIDLFCGLGSFHYSLEKLGFECVMASDSCKTCRETYYDNFGIQPLGDIRDIDEKAIGKYDILCAGFPCQPFSQAGKHKGFEDIRGTMFEEVMRFVKNKPLYVVLENVPALLKHKAVFEHIKESLIKEGYVIDFQILKCSDYGIPQMRKRLFIVGILEGCGARIDKFFDVIPHEPISLSEYLKKDFEKETAYTLRCGGRNSAINDRHNWDGYIVDGKEYRLTIDDCLKLQGFEDYKLSGNQTQKWRMLGNTIPTNLTRIIGEQIIKSIPSF